MKRKKLLLPRSIKLLGDNIDNMTKQTQLQVFKEWSCIVCGINVYGSKKMLVEHHKIHNTRPKENEVFKKDYKLY